ncbi:MAG: HAMP domain-containing sensor histidine kinase [bacterium]|nr:HAMP domain-containing sensor histidine kinase [bacterium]
MNLVESYGNIVVVIIAMLSCIITAFFVRLYYIRSYDRYGKKIGRVIDSMIEGKPLDIQTTGETLEDKLTYKLKRLYEIVEQSISQSQKEKDSLKILLGDISHQVKTPIANIKLYQNILMEREVSPEKQKEFLQLCNGQVEKLEFLMAAMVKLSRLENGVIQLTPKTQLVLPTLANALSQISQKAEAKGIEVSVQCSHDSYAFFDAKWTEEALVNVLDNGVKYAKKGGYLKISVNDYEIYTVIKVQDNGIGIRENEQGAIFKRFYRSPRVASIEGVGVGLALTREIITKEYGFIKVTSVLGEGSTFQIYLQKENLSIL